MHGSIVMMFIIIDLYQYSSLRIIDLRTLVLYMCVYIALYILLCYIYFIYINIAHTFYYVHVLLERCITSMYNFLYTLSNIVLTRSGLR